MISVVKLREAYNKINSSQKKSVIGDTSNIRDINALNELFVTFQYIQKGFYKKLRYKKKLIIEEYKLAILQAITNSLNEQQMISKRKKKKSIFKKSFANAFSFLTPIFTGIGGFTGFKGLLSLIPGISNPVVLVLGICVGVIEAALSISSDVRDVRKNLGVSPLQATPLLRVYTKQLEATQKIHDSLLSSRCVNRLNVREYETYKKTVDILNTDIKEKNAVLSKKHKESPIRKGFKWLIGGVEAILFTGSGYFMAQGILGLCASTLLATPVGWAIGGAAAFFSLSSFNYLRRKNLSKVVDHISGDPKTLKKSQDNFINGNKGIKKFDKEIDLIIAAKKKSESEFEKLTKKVKFLKTRIQSKSRLFNASKNQLHNRINSNFFFYFKKKNNQSDKSSFCSTQTRRIRSV